MKRTFLIIALALLTLPVLAQEEEEEKPDFHQILQSSLNYDPSGLPTVEIETDAVFLMRAFHPQYYESERQMALDIRWVNRNDSTFRAVWDSLGYPALALIEQLSGIPWREKAIDLYLLRYMRTRGMYDPLAIPMEGLKLKNYNEAAPVGVEKFLDLLILLSGRNLLQAELPGATELHTAQHPLTDKSAYRFDVLAMTVAFSVAERLLPNDSITEITSRATWKRHYPGWFVFENHFRYSWVLSEDQTLARYLADEPYSSALVELTRPPRIKKPQPKEDKPEDKIKLAAGGGTLGFSVVRTDRGYLEVVDLDTAGLAFNSGLMEGDQIKRVNGEYARNARELMGMILDHIYSDGVYMIVVRDQQEMGILMLPSVQDPYDKYYRQFEE